MEKLILTDADGTLVFWIQGFTDFMKKKGYKPIPGTDSDYRMTEKFGIPSTLAHSYIKEFNEGPEIAKLKPLADAVQYVKKLHNEKGFRFIVITAQSDAPDAKKYREENLNNIFGDIFEEIICIKMGADKRTTLSRWEDSKLFWIEDHMAQAESGYEVGLSPILINQPYNSHYKTDLFPTVSFENPWKEIYEIVCNKYKLDL